MPRTAFLLYGIRELKGGGGAERFFSDFFDKYQDYPDKEHKLYFILDRDTYKNLRSVNKLNSKKNLHFFRIFSNRFKIMLETIQIVFFIVLNKINIIHIPLYDISYVPLMQQLSKLPAFIRPKIVVNIVNCYIAQLLADETHPKHSEIQRAYLPLFKDVQVDGYFCWNSSFVDYVLANKVFNYQPKKVQYITSRFADTAKFYPEKDKQDLVVFASRLDEQKHADWYVKAVEYLRDEHSSEIKGWQFILCGNGPMREALIEHADKKQLQEILSFRLEGEMHKIFNHSKIYVSCQDYDNFPSLSMAEAMAAGNAIVARNVGQTNLFVKNNLNGLLIEPDNAKGVAIACLELIKNKKKLEEMGKESIRLIKEVHTMPAFTKQIDEFWTLIAN